MKPSEQAMDIAKRWALNKSDRGRLAGEVQKALDDERDRCVRLTRDLSEYYPTDIFPEIEMQQEGKPEPSRDCVAASMARHVCGVLVAAFKHDDNRGIR